MLISEIFYSVQGEGELTGVPSVFIRTSGCNLRCRWCDTPYASWNPEGTEMSVVQILAEVEKHPAAHVVLTGGEPMVARGIHELATALRSGTHDEQALEFADVLAWLATIANVVGVDLEDAVARKYGSGCPGCGRLACICPDAEKP